LTITPEGLFIKGELFPPKNEASSTLPTPKDNYGRTIEGFESFRDKADEVWEAIRQGFFRGLSVNGKARKRAVWSPQLNKYVSQVVEVLLYEISITPTQVHPGSRITAVNTLAKALSITKALPIYNSERKDPMNKQDEVRAAQEALISSLRDLGADGELPEEFLQLHDEITKAIEIEEVPGDLVPAPIADPEVEKSLITEAVTAALEPVVARLAQLEGVPAPHRNQTTHDAPDGAAPKPGAGPTDSPTAIEKALDALSRSKDGQADYGEGETHRCDAVTAMKLIMIRGAASGKIKADNTVLAPHEQKFFAAQAAK